MLPTLALCSFMVVGPPGAPPLRSYGSASEALKTNIRYRTLFSDTDGITSNVTEANSYASPPVNNRVVNGGDKYFWLADAKMMNGNKVPSIYTLSIVANQYRCRLLRPGTRYGATSRNHLTTPKVMDQRTIGMPFHERLKIQCRVRKDVAPIAMPRQQKEQ